MTTDCTAATCSTRTYRLNDSQVTYLQGVIEKFRAQAARLAKKGYEVAAPAMTITGEVWEPQAKGLPIRLNTVTVTGEAPKVAGWTFAAKVDHSLAGGNVVSSFAPIGDYSQAAPTCDHCHQNRGRNATYVVISESGEERQIGSTCLLDYTGGLSPQACAAYAEVWEAIEASERDEFGGSAPMAWRPVDILSLACAVVRESGFVGSSAPGVPTKYRIEDALRPRFPEQRVTITPEDVARAEAVVAWATALPGGSEFDRNMRAIATSPSVSAKFLGTIAYMPEALNRAESKAVREVAKAAVAADSTFFGTEGAKFAGEQVTIVSSDRLIQSQYTSYLQEFVTASGSILKWFSSSTIGMNPGEVVTLSGTVKTHREFRGAKETTVTRCKVS
jgi:hypothetical protein